MVEVGKRGLSDVIATLMIILLVIVAVGIVWVVVRNVISSGSEEIELGRFSYDLNIRSAYLDSQNSVDVVRVTVRRNAGGENLSGMRFTFSDGGNSYIADRKTPLEETGEKSFIFSSIELGVNTTSLNEVSVVPIYEVSGRERIGDIMDAVDIGGHPPPGRGGGSGAFCGDGTCDVGESAASCPVDCSGGGPENVPNGGMEAASAGLATNWSVAKTAPGTYVVSDAEPANIISGTRTQKIVATGVEHLRFTQSNTWVILSNTSYHLKATYKATTGGTKTFVGVSDIVGGGQGSLFSQNLITDNNWHTADFYFTTPSNLTGTGYIDMPRIDSLTGTTTVYIDNVSIRENQP